MSWVSYVTVRLDIVAHTVKVGQILRGFPFHAVACGIPTQLLCVSGEAELLPIFLTPSPFPLEAPHRLECENELALIRSPTFFK